MTAPVSAPIKVVFKAHGGYDSPWITVEAATPDAAVALLEEFESAGGGARLGAVDESLKTQYQAAKQDAAGDANVTAQATVQAAMPAQAVQRSQPAQQRSVAPPPPGQDAPLCEGHGVPMTFRSGTSKASGKPWKGYFCAGTRDRDSQCPPEFIR